MPRLLQLNQTAPFAVRNGAQRIGERLAMARKRRRLTLRELASKAGISYDTARAVEAGNLQTGNPLFYQKLEHSTWVFLLAKNC